jgi:hypothetical protein
MDWIERLFGVSPDGGNGATEAMILFSLGVAIVLLLTALVPSLRERVRRIFARLTSL